MLASLRGLMLALVAVALIAGPALAEPHKLVVLHLNDWDKMGPAGKIAAVIDAEKTAAEAEGATVLITFGGDLISPSLMSGIDQGAHMVELLEQVGVQYAVPGNHEFDFGPEVFKTRIAESDFPWLASNITESGAVFPGVAAPVMLEIGGYKVGLMGLTTPDTAFLSSPGPEVVFEAYETAGPRAADTLKEQGAEFVIVLSHAGAAMEHELTRTVKAVDLVLGGHDHVARTVYDGRDMTASAGAQGEFIAKTVITLDRVERRGKERVVWKPTFELVATSDATPDAGVQAQVDEYMAALDAELGQVIGATAVELDTRRGSIRSQETAFGNLVAEASRVATDADIGFANGGGIRGDTTYAAGSELTRKTILSELPFGNSTVKLELTGAQLREALETGVSRVEETAGRFPQVAGMTFSFDASKPAGSRVVDVTVGGAALDDAATYTLATNDYVAGGGDGYAVFRQAKVLIDAAAGGLLAGQVIDYVLAAGTVETAVDGRIKRMD